MHLIHHEYMHHWIHIAWEDQHLWPCFQSFLNDTLVESISEEFDVACGLIMNRLMGFGKDALLNRRRTAADSFEYQLFHWLFSNEFAQICSTKLPKAMKSYRAGWKIILATYLGSFFKSGWSMVFVSSERRRVLSSLTGFRVRSHICDHSNDKPPCKLVISRDIEN